MEENAGEKLKPGKGKSGSKTAKAQAQNGTGIGAAATSAANGNKSNRVGPVNGGVQQGLLVRDCISLVYKFKPKNINFLG